MVACLVLRICRRVVNKEPHVNIRNKIVINIRITVDIGEKRTRYLIRKYQINPRIKDNKRTKCEEIFTGDVSINADGSKVFRFKCPSFLGLVDSTRLVLI
jgi:hypothetical protein